MSQKPATEKMDKTRTRRASSQPAASPQRQPAASAAPLDISTAMDAKLNRILVRLDGLDSGVATLKDAISVTNDTVMGTNELVTGASTSIATITTDNASFKSRYDADIARLTALLDESRLAREVERREKFKLQTQLAMVKESHGQLLDQVNSMENRLRIKNIRIDGKVEEDGEDLHRFVLGVAERIGITNMARADISAVYRIGAKHQNLRTRPRARTIMVVFSTEVIRNRFFFARTKLKNIDWLKGVFLNDDVTAHTRKLREDYRSVASLARARQADVRIHTDGIVLDGTKYLLTEQHRLPAKYSLANAKTVEEGGELYFSSEHSFLSNFSPSPILDGETLYATAEHMYQALKCRHAGNSDLQQRVTVASTPLEAKRMADIIRETPEWRNERDTVMARVIREKFAQNAHLATQLLKTGDLKLNEATRNDHFGIGVNLHAREIRDKSYRGTNRLGAILMTTREELKPSVGNN